MGDGGVAGERTGTHDNVYGVPVLAQAPHAYTSPCAVSRADQSPAAHTRATDVAENRDDAGLTMGDGEASAIAVGGRPHCAAPFAPHANTWPRPLSAIAWSAPVDTCVTTSRDDTGRGGAPATNNRQRWQWKTGWKWDAALHVAMA
jgi:hypothetical protein